MTDSSPSSSSSSSSSSFDSDEVVSGSVVAAFDAFFADDVDLLAFAYERALPSHLAGGGASDETHSTKVEPCAA